MDAGLLCHLFVSYPEAINANQGFNKILDKKTAIGHLLSKGNHISSVV